MRKSNKKLYVLSVVPIIAILYFLTATGIQDDSMWDISTNEYIQRGADFELFAMTCSPYWSESFKKIMGCDETSTPSTPSTHTPSTPSTPTDYTGDFYCKSNVVMSYNDDIRQRWIQYGSTWSDVDLNLASTQGGGKVDEIKGVINMKCDWNGNGSVKLLSGNVGTFVLNGWNGGSYTIPEINDYLMPNTKLEKGVKTEVGVINILETDIDKIENMLDVDSSNNVGITFTVSVDSKFLLNGIDTVHSKSIHQSSMKFTKLLEEVKVVTQANSRYERITIESIERTAYPALDLMGSSGDKLNTNVDIKKNQIKVKTSMSKYLFDEGSPIITFSGPDGTVMKYTARLAEKVGDTQFFETYWTLPLNAKEGKWNVYVDNINRDQTGTSSFYVQNTTTTPVDCPEYDKNGNPIIYQQRDECYTGNTPSTDEVKQLEDLRVGVIWEVKDGGGKTLQCTGCHGNSFVDGNSIIPQLTELALISEIVDDRSGSTLKFYQIMIQPIIQFDDKSQDINKYRYAQSYDPLKIPITLSIPDDQGAGTKTKYIERTTTGTGYYKILGTGYMSQADADYLAETAGYEVGDRFTVEAKIGGEFTLTSNTNKDYNFVFDDVKITKEFQYGIKGESFIPSEQKQKDDEWNDCLEQIDQFGRNKIPNNDGWNNGFQCQTVDEYDKQQCENNGMIWSTVRIIDYGGYCVEDVGLPPNPSEDDLKTAQEKCEDSQSDSGSYTWNVGQEMCIFNPDPTSTQPRNGGDDDVDDDVGSSSGNLQLCSPGQSISDCIKDLQVKQSSLINFDDNTIMIIGIIFAVLILVAIIARRRQPSMGGLMSRYG